MSYTAILKSLGDNKGKIGTGLAAIVLSVAMVNQRITFVEKNTLAIVDMKHEAVMTELRHIAKAQDEQNKILEKIDQRVYELKQKTITSSFIEKEENKKEL